MFGLEKVTLCLSVCECADCRPSILCLVIFVTSKVPSKPGLELQVDQKDNSLFSFLVSLHFSALATSIVLLTKK